MLSSEDKSTDTEAIAQKKVLSDTSLPCQHKLEYELGFPFIESLLSFEACLYYQILPLKVENNCLLLGVVNPQDTTALDYVYRIVSYVNYTLVTQPIKSDIHRQALSAFLYHKNTSQLPQQQEYQPNEDLVQANIAEQQLSSTNTNSKLDYQPTLVLSQTPIPQNSFINSEKLLQHTHYPKLLVIMQSKKEEKQEEYTVNSGAMDNLPVLSVPDPEELSPLDLLLTFPPKKLLEELLGRVLIGGIGRLYLQRQPYTGRILWSENGTLQSVLEKVSLSIFQGVMNELKRFGSLSITTLAEPKQIEKECLYKRERLLLRLRIMPGTHGEEATLQVLRGAALKFYQQQQLTRLSRDALGMSQQLSYKLHEMQQRLTLNYNVNTNHLETFEYLNELLSNLERHIKRLTLEISEPPTRS